jgi:hypothetical protein
MQALFERRKPAGQEVHRGGVHGSRAWYLLFRSNISLSVVNAKNYLVVLNHECAQLEFMSYGKLGASP